MSDGNDFVRLGLESLFNFGKRGTIADGGFELCRIGSVNLKTFGKRIGKITRN
jgi:hypothetical protein